MARTFAVTYRHMEQRIAYVAADNKVEAAKKVRNRQEEDSDFDAEVGNRTVIQVTDVGGV